MTRHPELSSQIRFTLSLMRLATAPHAGGAEKPQVPAGLDLEKLADAIGLKPMQPVRVRARRPA
jgi:hypothetical protein